MTYTTLHKHHHADYSIAQEHILRQIGKLDLELFGRDVLVAQYIRPLENPLTGWTTTGARQREDVVQGKIVMVVALGPSAFTGDESYLEATFGKSGAPKVGDWLMTRATDGHPVNIAGEGAETIMYRDRHDEEHKAYDWDSGWPCRIINDENFIGRVLNPHIAV
jgi:hypothetical protein